MATSISDPAPHLAPVAFVRHGEQARSLLDPLRREILQQLKDPGSASTVADALSLPRQRINYHVRELESQGLLWHVEDRRKGNCVERVVRATAVRYVIDPSILGGSESRTPGNAEPRLSYFTEDLVAAANRTLSDLAELLEPDPGVAERLPTLSLETHIRFRSPDEEAEFAKSIREVLDRMTRRYHDPSAHGGRDFRLTLGGHLDPGVGERD